MALRNDISEDRFLQALNREVKAPEIERSGNIHSSEFYRSIQFTGRHLIKYRNPFADEFIKLRHRAKKIMDEHDDPLAKQIMGIKHSQATQNIRFFYPFEVQIIDQELKKTMWRERLATRSTKKTNSIRPCIDSFASLIEYQNLDAAKRLRLSDLLRFYGLNVDGWQKQGAH